MRTLALVLSLLAISALGLVACDGGDDDDDSASEQAIEQAGNEWAALFSADGFGNSCQHMTQPFCEQIGCERAGGQPIRNCTPPPSEFRSSFEDATVQDVAIKGKQATARFSNRETVEVVNAGGGWLIHEFSRDGGRKLFD